MKCAHRPGAAARASAPELRSRADVDALDRAHGRARPSPRPSQRNQSSRRVPPQARSPGIGGRLRHERALRPPRHPPDRRRARPERGVRCRVARRRARWPMAAPWARLPSEPAAPLARVERCPQEVRRFPAHRRPYPRWCAPPRQAAPLRPLPAARPGRLGSRSRLPVRSACYPQASPPRAPSRACPRWCGSPCRVRRRAPRLGAERRGPAPRPGLASGGAGLRPPAPRRRQSCATPAAGPLGPSRAKSRRTGTRARLPVWAPRTAGNATCVRM